MESPENDFTRSSWRDRDHALQEIDALIAAATTGSHPPVAEAAVLFLPTGPLQEVALASQWGAEFLRLAERFEAVTRTAARASFACSLCGAPAGEVLLSGTAAEGELWRASPLTGVMSRWPQGAAFEALEGPIASGDPAALFAADPELLPAYCPQCRRVYCQAHWLVWFERDEDSDFFWVDCFRGRCPEGHERMLED